MNKPTTPLRMSDEEFRLIRDAISRHCGIYFDDAMKYLLERRLARRVEAHMLRSFREYEQFLRYDPAREGELQELVELLTTNETYFFREGYQLEALSEEILPELIGRKNKEGRQRLRLWSAGCSTGEEAYTLAIELARQPRLAGWEWEVLASDISHRALQRARSAVYGPHSFRNGLPEAARRFFTAEEGDRLQVKDALRRKVTFSAINLLDTERLGLIRSLDAIFCRNVLIYFDPETRRRVVDMFFEKLSPGGFLFLGHSESLINLSTKFALRHFEKDMVYQRPLTALGGEA